MLLFLELEPSLRSEHVRIGAPEFRITTISDDVTEESHAFLDVDMRNKIAVLVLDRM